MTTYFSQNVQGLSSQVKESEAAVRFQAGSYSGWIGPDRMLPSWKTARIHPSYPGSNRAWFEIPVPAEWLALPEVRLRVEVENKSGVVTEIDRRRVRPVP